MVKKFWNVCNDNFPVHWYMWCCPESRYWRTTWVSYKIASFILRWKILRVQSQPCFSFFVTSWVHLWMGCIYCIKFYYFSLLKKSRCQQIEESFGRMSTVRCPRRSTWEHRVMFVVNFQFDFFECKQEIESEFEF